MFGESALDRIYRVNNIVFRVLDIEPYPRNKVSKQYLEIFNFPAGVLIAVLYRGILIPNITFTGGVVRLMKVKIINGDVYNNPKAISEVLGVEKAMCSYDLIRY